ncbi:MAG: hypothetical protein LQ351_005406 [Letrouitia transgressa]|nr:MAG: hypothetical protein LQ351_005406 [Letrouitia transgressa]
MGRPKRTKAATSNAPTRVSQPAVSSTLSQHTSISSPASSGVLTRESDDSERLVVKDRKGANCRGVPRQDALMSGALGPGDVGDKPLKLLRGRKRAALSRIARQADHDKAIETLKARRDALLARERGEAGQIQVPATQTMKTSSAQPTSMAAMTAIRSANVELRSDQGQKTKRTPLKDSSIIVAAQPKKRPRQPSLLQMAQIQKVVQDSEDDDSLGDFEPEDISTPLKIRPPQNQGTSPFSSIQHYPSSRKRKRPSLDTQLLASQLASEHTSSRPSSPPSPPDIPFNPLSKNDAPQLPLPQHASSRSFRQQVIHSDTLASPQSSSSPPPPKQLKNRSNHSRVPAKTENRNGRRAPTPLPPRSPTPTQPSTQRTVHPPAKALTTSTLQNFLPHRRVQHKAKGEVSTFDLPSSSEVGLVSTELGEDEDELSYRAGPSTLRKPKQAQPFKYKEKTNTGGKRSLAERASLTYSRKKAADKENSVDDRGGHDTVNDEEEDDNDIGGGFGHHDERERHTKMDGRAKAEVRRLVDKFREVDEWGLEFEEVTGSSDRMVDAR